MILRTEDYGKIGQSSRLSSETLRFSLRDKGLSHFQVTIRGRSPVLDAAGAIR